MKGKHISKNSQRKLQEKSKPILIPIQAVYDYKRADYYGKYGITFKGLDGVWEHVGTDRKSNKEILLQLNEGLYSKYQGYQLISKENFENMKIN